MTGYVYPLGRTAVLKDMYFIPEAQDMGSAYVVWQNRKPVFYGSVSECAEFCGVVKANIHNAERRGAKVRTKYFIKKMEMYEIKELFKDGKTL